MPGYYTCITEYDEAMNNELLRAECLAEGEKTGRAKEKIKNILDFFKEGYITENIAAEKANMSVAEFRKLASHFA